MKKELPIAVVLLAFGAWCCWLLPEGAGDVGPSGQAGGARHVKVPAGASVGVVIQTSWQIPESPRDGTKSKRDAGIQRDGVLDGGRSPGGAGDRRSSPFGLAAEAKPLATTDGGAGLRAMGPSAFLEAVSVPDQRHNDSVAAMVEQLAAAPALATRTRIVGDLFGVSMVANGKYFQTAGGKKSRLEIQCVSPVAKTVLQMSDGRFVYMLKSDRHQQNLEFIDLHRLNNRRATATGSLLPTTWVIGGGIGESLSHFVESFDFVETPTPRGQQAADAGQQVRVFRGVWKADVLLHLLNVAMEPEKQLQTVVWAKVPRQLPHAIELTFVTPAGAPAMPQQISFFQFEMDNQAAVAKEKVRIQLLPFEFRNRLPDDLFTLESTDFEVTDMTNVYNARISKLSQGMDKVANEFSPDIRGSGRR